MPETKVSKVPDDILIRLEKLEHHFNTCSILERLAKLESKTIKFVDSIKIIEPNISVLEDKTVIEFDLDNCCQIIYLVTDINFEERKVILNHGLLTCMIKSEFKMLKLTFGDDL